MISAWFKRQSVPGKIRVLIVGTTSAALLVAVGLLSAIEVIGYRQQLADRIATLARITAVNAMTAAEFEDRSGASVLLQSLSSEPSIDVAQIFAANGALVGRYIAPSQRNRTLPQSLDEVRPQHANAFATAQASDSTTQQHAFHGDHMDVTAPIRLNDDIIGIVHIQASLKQLYATLALYAWTTFVIMLAALAIAYAATMNLRKSISAPLLALVDVMRHVSAKQDYQARASKTGGDEVGALVDGFNEVLEQIQERDRRLDEHRRYLERQIAERTQHLETALDSARQASRAKSDFLARMSHEIRTPMNGVLGMTELLRNSSLDPRQRRLVDTVYTSGESLLQIINDILDFSKVEAGRMELAHIDFSLRDKIEETCELLGERADAKQLELICAIDQSVPGWINGDPLRIKQVLTNLIGNAIKFTERGEVAVHAKRLAGTSKLRFEVRDSGPGISQSDQKHVFQAFTQGDTLTTRPHGGTGLGLAIARQLVTLMRGEIGLESTPGKGTTFWFEIPYSPAIEPALVRMPRMSLVGTRALVVDDNPTNREIVHQYLSGWGVVADACEDGERALARLGAAALAGKPYDVIVLDHKMPLMDGLTCLRHIRNAPALRDTRVVLLSSMDLALRSADLEALRIDESLTKPVRQSRLYAALNRVLGHDVTMQTMMMRAHSVQATEADRGNALQGVQVLLVEDNEINREVALGMLAALGCETRVAANGAQAVEMFEHGGFDVVLMDCHMPVMDGFTAATAIRAIEIERHRTRVPIVALTANAMEGGRERCLAAGMDDFLTKPFAMSELRALVERWSQKKSSSAAPSPVHATADDSHEATLNTRAIDIIQSLHAPDLLARIVDLYTDRAPQLIKNGHEAVLANDADRLAIAAHELKSSSANLGGERLARVCKECETAARKQQLDDAHRHWLDICAEFDRFFAALKGLPATAKAC